jgi:predicted fused transcriptional regulator/phosphomethylpyrimidine kinase
VPDVIYNRGTAKKEPLLRIFAEKPAGVANNIIMLSNRIICIEL